MERRRATGVLLALVSALAAPIAFGDPSSGVRKESWTVEGLQAPGEIVIDHWGAPQIYAASTRDAFFLQGYNAARDRLWQIDLWRKRGLGLLAKSFGAAYLDQDRASRLFLYRGDMDREWAAYAPGAKEMVAAFSAGINAYVREVRAGKRPLPPEFALTQSTPEEWGPDDLVRIRSHALVANLAQEVIRAQVACAAGLKADRLRYKLEPAHTPVVPKGLNPCDVPKEVLRDYELGTGAVSFSALAGKRVASADPPFEEGSNNWTIAPARTATGRPILANDPHRALGVPSLRYIVGLHAPGLDIVGAGEPALPGITIGHNDDIAWGITIFRIDQEDLYAYALNPADPTQYRYGAGWEKMRQVRETIEVRGEAPRTVTLNFTRHGPVLWSDGRRAFALRTVWSEPGSLGYFASTWLWRAKSWTDFLKARDQWRAPPLNIVYADKSGNIGWVAAGGAPVRPNWDGLMPVPGDGRYEWKGFTAGKDLPSLYNPPEGFFATANEMNLPRGYPAGERKLGWEWTDPSRITRIKEVLRAKAKSTIADSMALQTDSHSAQSRRLVALLAPLKSSNAGVAQALRMLKAWDHDESVSSDAAAIYEVWATQHLVPAVIAKVVPAPAQPLFRAAQLEAVISYLEHPDGALGRNPRAARDALLLSSLGQAVAALQQRLGPDMSAWTWGQLHHATWAPAAAALADPALRAQMTVGPLQVGGSSSSPMATTYAPADFNAVAGASVRMVVDVGHWDNSRIINTPGESGDPMSAHYRDLFPLWAAGAYAPLPFTKDAVAAQAETILTLSPAR